MTSAVAIFLSCSGGTEFSRAKNSILRAPILFFPSLSG
jgi:hypothetical protein